jgi:flavin reductase (DIM6/NTAB) family NADH-FMN oxidoreductase RutF
MRIPVPLDKSWRLINHGPVVLVSASHAGQDNVMAAAWCMALDFKPPKLAVVIAEGTHTRTLVDASRQLVIQVPPRALLDAIDGVGNCSGRDVDKWARFGLARERASVVDAPLVSGCNAWLECRVIAGEDAIHARYDLFPCEIVAAWADDAVYDAHHDGARLRDDVPPARRAVHHVAGGVYVVDGEVVRARAG